MNEHDPVIVGSGPAGLSAAIQLAKHNVKCVLIDEASKVGGVVYRGPLRSGVSLEYLGDKYKNAMESLHSEYRRRRGLIQERLNSRVIGVEDNERLIILNDRDDLLEVPFSQLVLATGCHERSVPFPGWTLPGVMLLGGMQLQLKSSAVKPAGPVVIVGTGPLLPLVACQLCKAGVEVAGVFEIGTFNSFTAEVIALLNKPQLLLDGLSMLAWLRQRGVPVHYGWSIIEARGQDELAEVVVAPYDNDGHPERSRAMIIAARTLACGYGFLPRAQLSQLMGLEHAYRDDGTLAPVANDALRTQHQNIYIAGDLAGIKGGEAALLQGAIAAVGILEQRGVLTPIGADSERQYLHARLLRNIRFRAAFNRISMRGADLLLRLPREDTLICRCENVTRAQIDTAINQGMRDLVSLKMRTRISMGDCQGKMCIGYCVDRLRQLTRLIDVGWTRPRFPLEPIPFGAFTPNDSEQETA